MAASGSNLTTSATNALQALCGEIHRKITSAEEQLEELMEDVKS
jgi:hypothetical protein